MAASAAAAAAATPVGSAVAGTLAPENQTPGKADAMSGVTPVVPRYGWSVFDFEALDPAQMTALRAHRPTMLRWFVSWDRYHLQPNTGGTGSIIAPPDWLASPYKAFFEQMLPSSANPRGTTLIVQMLVKSPSWEGDWYPFYNPGTKWARNDKYFGRQYPDRFGVAPTYGAFVQKLDAALRSVGVDVIWEAWNEADLRSTIGPLGPNFLDPWYVNPFNLVSGVPYFYWSGGAGPMWQSLHQQLPGAAWGSSGLIWPSWIQRTAQFPEVGYIDLHRYYLYGQLTAQAYVKDIENLVAVWDKAAPGLPKRKVFLGECGLGSIKQDTDLAFAATLYRRHVALTKANSDPTSTLYGRYVGTIAHNGGPGCRSTWQLSPTDPAAAWWQYKPQYEAFKA